MLYFPSGKNAKQESDKQSDLEENLDDLQELINSEMTDFDRDLANYVVSGSELPVMLRPSEEELPVSEDLMGNNMYSSNTPSSICSGSSHEVAGRSIPLQSLPKLVVPQRKRARGEDFLELEGSSSLNTGMYSNAESSLPPCPPGKTPLVQSKVPRLNHMAPTATNSAPLACTPVAANQNMRAMPLQGMPQPNETSYQMTGFQQSNNGLMPGNGVQRRNSNQVVGASHSMIQNQGFLRSNSNTDELMADLVDDMLTDPQLHVGNSSGKNQGFNSQPQFESSYPLLERKIKQEALSPTTTQANFFGSCLNQGNFGQLPENSGCTQFSTTATLAGNATLGPHAPSRQTSTLARVNQPPNGTLLQTVYPSSSQPSAAITNQNGAGRSFDFPSQTFSDKRIQENLEYTQAAAKQQMNQQRLRTLLQQDAVGNNLSTTKFVGSQQLQYNPNLQQSYPMHSAQNTMAPERNQVYSPAQSVLYDPRFSIPNSAPARFPGSNEDAFQGLNNINNPNVRQMRQNANYPSAPL